MKQCASCHQRIRMKSRAMLHLARGAREPEEIDDAHLHAVMEGFEQAKRRAFASGAEVEATLLLFDL
jgi:hypothetical protein